MRSRVAADLRAVAAPALVAGMAFAGVSATASAPAQAAGACTGTSGVTVIVQFPSGTATGCAPGNPGTALSAIRSAGFTTVGSVRFHDAVVCAINGFPSSTPCVMPPASAYWAIFWADRGSSWVYSQLGVASLTLKPGQVLAFRYGSGEKPSAPVPGGDAPKPSSTPTSSKPTSARPTTKPSPHRSASHPATTPPATARPTPGTTTGPPATTRSAGSPSSRGGAAASSTQKPQVSASQNGASAAPSSTGATASATSAPGAADLSRPGTVTTRVTVKSTREVMVDGKKEKIVTFDDGSTITVAADAKDASKYRVGAVIERTTDHSSAPMTVDAPSSSVASHPSISVSGSVPGLTAPEAKKSEDSNNLPGIIAGAGVLGVAGVGAGVAAMRRRG